MIASPADISAPPPAVTSRRNVGDALHGHEDLTATTSRGWPPTPAPAPRRRSSRQRWQAPSGRSRVPPGSFCDHDQRERRQRGPWVVGESETGPLCEYWHHREQHCRRKVDPPVVCHPNCQRVDKDGDHKRADNRIPRNTHLAALIPSRRLVCYYSVTTISGSPFATSAGNPENTMKSKTPVASAASHSI